MTHKTDLARMYGAAPNPESTWLDANLVSSRADRPASTSAKNEDQVGSLTLDEAEQVARRLLEQIELARQAGSVDR